jgi:prepilin-type N-terminal cleavage/methylation domain
MKSLHKNQKGFTLIEILIATVLTGVVVAAATASIIQLFQSTSTSAHMAAIRQVQTAGYWISKDGLQAQIITATDPNVDPAGFPLNLKWTDWEGVSHNITYTLEPTGDLYKLQRSSNVSTNMTAAQHLTGHTACAWNVSAGILTLFVKAEVAGARGPQTETRTYEIKPRPDPVS